MQSASLSLPTCADIVSGKATTVSESDEIEIILCVADQRDENAVPPLSLDAPVVAAIDDSKVSFLRLLTSFPAPLQAPLLPQPPPRLPLPPGVLRSRLSGIVP